ncbi:MAG: hypothetical protein WDZ46_06765 [Solirubrobacterales bacterium]
MALIVAVAFAGIPAIAAPVASTSANVAKQIRKALRLGVVANKRSVNAIKIARNAAQQGGMQGPAGPVGAVGPKGADGAQGQDGAAGPEGPAGPQGLQGEQGPAGEDGATGPEGPAGADGATGPEGPEGSPWTAGGTLPSGETLTGMFGYAATPGFGGVISVTTISFPIPLAAPPAEAHFVTKEEIAEEEAPAACPGNVADPKAAAGSLCLYEEEFIEMDEPNVNPTKVGALLNWINEDGVASGSFAVTAP